MSVNAPRSIDGVFMDVRAYTSLFYMLLTLATGIVYGAVGGAGVHRHTVTGGCAAPGPAHRRHGVLRRRADRDFAIAHHSLLGSLVLGVLGALTVTLLMHVARGVARGHARLAKALLVEPGA